MRHVGISQKEKKNVSPFRCENKSSRLFELLYPRRSALSELRFVVPWSACRRGNSTITAAAAAAAAPAAAAAAVRLVVQSMAQSQPKKKSACGFLLGCRVLAVS